MKLALFFAATLLLMVSWLVAVTAQVPVPVLVAGEVLLWALVVATGWALARSESEGDASH